MKLSSKEKVLLATLGGLLVGGAYYRFVFQKQMDNVYTLTQTRDELKSKYIEVMESIAMLDNREQKVKDLLAEINSKTAGFYPEIMQEKIILEIDSYLNESGLEGNLNFNESAVQAVEKFTSSEEEKSASTFKDSVDLYNGVETETSTSEENEDNTEEGTDTTNEEESEEESEDESSQPTVEVLKVAINFKGTYPQLKKFISQVELSDRDILITDLSSNVGDNGELSGTMNLEFYAIPKISAKDKTYLKWDLQNKYGKNVPFLIQKPQEVVEDVESSQASSDFAILVKSITSDLPSVMIGKSTDTTQSTYIMNKENSVQQGEIEFNKIDGKYYCKYKIGSSKKSEAYNDNGISFVPTSENIIIEVNSEQRQGTDDKAGLKLNVKNNTDKIVKVVIKNDDSDARVSVTGNSKNTKVTRK